MRKVSIGWRLRNYFVAGLLIVLPLVVASFVVYWLFSASTNLFIRFLPPRYLDSTLTRFLVRLLTLVGLAALFTLVGAFAHNVIGKRIITLVERAVGRIPGFSKIYLAVKQIGEAFIGARSTVFTKVVMVEYPRKGLFVLGFQTSESRGEVQGKTAERMVNVFVPTSPNPTSGLLIIAPGKDVIELDMSVEEGMKMVISCGAVSPEKLGEEKIRKDG